MGRRVQCPRCEHVFRYRGQRELTLGRVRPSTGPASIPLPIPRAPSSAPPADDLERMLAEAPPSVEAEMPIVAEEELIDLEVVDADVVPFEEVEVVEPAAAPPTASSEPNDDDIAAMLAEAEPPKPLRPDERPTEVIPPVVADDARPVEALDAEAEDLFEAEPIEIIDAESVDDIVAEPVEILDAEPVEVIEEAEPEDLGTIPPLAAPVAAPPVIAAPITDPTGTPAVVATPVAAPIAAAPLATPVAGNVPQAFPAAPVATALPVPPTSDSSIPMAAPIASVIPMPPPPRYAAPPPPRPSHPSNEAVTEEIDMDAILAAERDAFAIPNVPEPAASPSDQTSIDADDVALQAFLEQSPSLPDDGTLADAEAPVGATVPLEFEEDKDLEAWLQDEPPDLPDPLEEKSTRPAAKAPAARDEGTEIEFEVPPGLLSHGPATEPDLDLAGPPRTSTVAPHISAATEPELDLPPSPPKPSAAPRQAPPFTHTEPEIDLAELFKDDDVVEAATKASSEEVLVDDEAFVIEDEPPAPAPPKKK